MIPIHDDNPTERTPWATYVLVATCCAVFLWQLTLDPVEERRALLALGMIPVLLLGDAYLNPEIALAPAWASVVTSMFLHGGWMHLTSNMLYLYIFGNNVEDAMGRVRFVLFYGLCGAVAALVQALTEPGSEIPMIGASGAIAGVLGAYMLLYPHARVLVVLPIFLIIPVRVPAMIVLGLWFGTQMFNLISTGPDDGIAWTAHVGGFLVGLALVIPFKRKGVNLFNPARPTPANTRFFRRPSGRGGKAPWVQAAEQRAAAKAAKPAPPSKPPAPSYMRPIKGGEPDRPKSNRSRIPRSGGA